MTTVQAETSADLLRHITALRHDLHRHPELGYQEKYTSALVAQELTRLNIPHTTGLAGGTGIVGLIHGSTPGPCVALRADMDALPIHETTNLPYASLSSGLMHACGHDGHTAILLGAAAILQDRRASLKGTVKLLFQPAEEGGRGAHRMCQDGVLNNPRVDAIFGLHGWPGMKVGTVGTKPGALLAGVYGFHIQLHGKGGHAAIPPDTIDPILCAATLIPTLQSIITREIDPADPAVLAVTQINAGSAFNITPETADLVGTTRALTAATRDKILAAIERLTLHTAAAFRCKSKVTFKDRTPPTTNDPALAEFVRETAATVVGPARTISLPRAAMWGEDFAFYLEHVAGCFYVLGVQPQDAHDYPMLHNSNFDFTDAALPHGINMMVALAERYLAK